MYARHLDTTGHFNDDLQRVRAAVILVVESFVSTFPFETCTYGDPPGALLYTRRGNDRPKLLKLDVLSCKLSIPLAS